MHEVGMVMMVHHQADLDITRSECALQAKPENVVKAPQKPASRSARKTPVVVARTTPATSDPATLTTCRPQVN